LKYSPDTLDVQAYFYMHQKLEVVKKVSIINKDDMWRQFVYIRLQATVPLIAHKKNILQALKEMRKNVRFLFNVYSDIT